MDVPDVNQYGRIPSSFLHDSLQKQLHVLPNLSDGGPVNRYAFGVSFVYEKKKVQAISSKWPEFRAKFTGDFASLGLHGGQPPKDNVFRTSRETVFVYWINKEPRVLLAMYKTRNAFLSATCNALVRIRDRKTRIALRCGIFKICIHKIFALEHQALPGRGLDWLPAGYKFNYDESDVMFFGYNPTNLNASAPTSGNICGTSHLNGHSELQYTDEDVAEVNSRKRPYTRREPSPQDNRERNQIKRARHAVSSSPTSEDLDSNSASDEDENNKDTYMKFEEVKVKIVDRNEGPIPDVQDPVLRFSAAQPRHSEPDTQPQAPISNMRAGSPLRTSSLDNFFTNMETVRAEFTALRNENARLQQELGEERERRAQAEQAVARVRRAVSGTTS